MTITSDQYEISMNFSWLVDGALAGCRGPRSLKDLDFLISKGIRVLIRLAYEQETGLTREQVIQRGLEDYYEPVKDFSAPSQKQIDHTIKFIRKAIDQKRSVAVSCGAGYGRTGTILACYLVSIGYSFDHAIDFLILRRPVSNEIKRIPEQKTAVGEFARRIRSGEATI